MACLQKGRRRAVRAHLANEERLLGALSANERAQLTRLLRKLLVAEPFVAQDPPHSVARDGAVAERTTRRRVRRRR